jgi:hypothetical protein
LTDDDLPTNIMGVVNVYGQGEELKNIARRSLRTRVELFQDLATWPTGTHPYGYGKRLYDTDGKLLWEWQPVNRTRGQIFYPDANGNLKPGPTDVAVPRKMKRQKTKLVPSNDPKVVKAATLVFDLYTRVGLSRRQIAARLNAEGFKFNGTTFRHTDVTNILRNPVYAGDTHFGKVQTGVFYSFDASGTVGKIKTKRDKKNRNASERLVKENTHDALIDRDTFKRAQAKLAAERERTSHSPRNAAYFLKTVLVCGHCGKSMTGRTEIDPTTKKRKVVYVCASYINGRCNGTTSECGYQRITHADAEKLLTDKIAGLNLHTDLAVSTGARANIKNRLSALGMKDDEQSDQWDKAITEGVNSFARFMVDEYDVGLEDITKVRRFAFNHYCGDETDHDLSRFTRDLCKLKSVIQSVESKAVAKAKANLEAVRKKHRTLTVTWAEASADMKAVLREEIEGLEKEIAVLEPKTTPLADRLESVYAEESKIAGERSKLLAELPTLEAREKGEAFRRLFKSVKLYWSRTFREASKTPTRPRKTNRAGRYSYALQTERIEWGFADFNSDSTS